MQILLALVNSSVLHQSISLHVNDDCAFYHPRVSPHWTKCCIQTDSRVHPRTQVCVCVCVYRPASRSPVQRENRDSDPSICCWHCDGNAAFVPFIFSDSTVCCICSRQKRCKITNNSLCAWLTCAAVYRNSQWTHTKTNHRKQKKENLCAVKLLRHHLLNFPLLFR